MSKRTTGSINHPSLWLLAAAICLCPAAAKAQTGNTATGTAALSSNTSGDYNTADGFYALSENTTGSFNSASGAFALFSNTTGSSNTATGYIALNSNTGGGYNTATGHSALYANTGGGFNTATGYAALYYNTTGGYNTAIGPYALSENSTGGYNTAIGPNAAYENTTGLYNTATGYQALNGNTTGSNNTAIGADALAKIVGNNNIALGANAGSATQTGSHNIYIGNPGVSAGENRVTRIGPPQQTKTFIAGITGVPLSGATVVVRSTGQLGVVASSDRYKQDIAPLTGASQKLRQLRPVSYRYTAEPDATHYGLIAEEVEKVMPELVVRDEEGRPESVQYLELIPLLLQERQELQAELARQRAVAEQQAEALTALRRMVEARFATLDQGGGQSVAALK